MKRKLVLLGLLVLTSGSLFAQNTVKGKQDVKKQFHHRSNLYNLW